MSAIHGEATKNVELPRRVSVSDPSTRIVAHRSACQSLHLAPLAKCQVPNSSACVEKSADLSSTHRVKHACTVPAFHRLHPLHVARTLSKARASTNTQPCCLMESASILAIAITSSTAIRYRDAWVAVCGPAKTMVIASGATVIGSAMVVCEPVRVPKPS